MKRQHPDNPDLFWCPECKGYKARGEFWNMKRNSAGIQAKCKVCQKAYSELNPLVHKAASLKYSQAHLSERRERYKRDRDLHRTYSKMYRARNPHKFDELKKIYSDRARAELLDSYIRLALHQVGTAITPERIEQKRQMIVLYRNIKQLGGIRDGLINKECNGNQQGI